MDKLNAEYAAFIIETCIVTNFEIMPLTGAAHVVIAVQSQLYGPACQPGHHGRHDGPLCRLGLLTAKGTTNPANLYRHSIDRFSKTAGHQVLHLGRMLGRGQDQHVPIFVGYGNGDLAFKVKVILATGEDLTLQAMGCFCNGCVWFTPLQNVRLEHKRFFCQGGFDIQYGW